MNASSDQARRATGPSPRSFALRVSLQALPRAHTPISPMHIPRLAKPDGRGKQTCIFLFGAECFSAEYFLV